MKIEGPEGGSQSNVRRPLRRRGGRMGMPDVDDAESAEPKTFIEMLSQTDDERRQKKSLQQLIAEIDAAGKKLELYPTLDSLNEYKALIMQFLSGSLDNVRLEERRRHPRSPLQDPIHIKKVIDEKLEDLTDEVMRREKQHVRIVALMEEIRGILIDLKN